MYLATFKVADSDIMFDIHDTIRVSRHSEHVNYYVTEQRYVQIRIWMAKNNITHKLGAVEAKRLIELGVIGMYRNTGVVNE